MRHSPNVVNIKTTSLSSLSSLTTVANQAAMVILNTELMVKTKVIQEELETRKFGGACQGDSHAAPGYERR
jgi:hypothetical protein